MNLLLPFEKKESTLYKTVGWVSAGLGAVALGLVVGNEIRQRYKFNRRTPYDNFGHSGDESHDMDSASGYKGRLRQDSCPLAFACRVLCGSRTTPRSLNAIR